MWIDKRTFEALVKHGNWQNEQILYLEAKLESVEAHHKFQEDALAQDMATIARLTAELSAAALELQRLRQVDAKAAKPLHAMPPPKLGPWAADVDWERVEGGVEQP